jgi:hypothetical protein
MHKPSTLLFTSAVLLASTAVAGTGAANAAPTEKSLFVATNTAKGISVSDIDATAPATVLDGVLLDTAADGSGHVTQATLPGGAKVPVYTNAATAKATIVNAAKNATFSAGNNTLATLSGTNLSVLDKATGKQVSLPGVPAADQGKRTITDFAPFGEGALVATVDYDHVTSTATVFGSDIWVIDALGVTPVAQFDDRYFPALSVAADTAHALGVSTTDNTLSLYTVGADNAENVDLTLPGDTTDADLVYRSTSTANPVVVFNRPSGSTINGLDGTELAAYPAGVSVFASAQTLDAATTVANPLKVRASLSGLGKGTVDYKTKVAATASAVVDVFGTDADYATDLAIKNGTKVTTVHNGVATALKANTCYVTDAASSQFTKVSNKSECVDVRHDLNLKAQKKSKKVTAFSATSKTLVVQVAKGKGFETVKTLKVKKGKATFAAPKGTYRVSAPASATNEQKTVTVRSK